MVWSVPITVWFGVCESQEVKQTDSGDKSSNVYVAGRTGLGVRVQQDNASGGFCVSTGVIAPVVLVNIIVVKWKGHPVTVYTVLYIYFSYSGCKNNKHNLYFLLS